MDAVGWAIRLAKRIESMHVLGVIHGSVSPSCMLLDAEDRTARGFLVDVRRAPSSAAFHSPERTSGGGLSQADDVWALAATLYAALTGGPPFSGVNDAEIRHRVLTGSPAPLAVYDVGDDDLQRVFDDAFTRDMVQRTTSVAEFRRGLEEWHPDPNVGALPGLEDEDVDGGMGDDDDELDARTIMRTAPRTIEDLGLGPLPAAPPQSFPDDDDDDDVRTRTRPTQEAAAPLAGAPLDPSRSGAFAAAAPTQSGAFPAQPRGDDDEATRMLPSPAFPPDDDDEQATLMRPSPTADEVDQVLSQMKGGGGARAAPHGGVSDLGATVALDAMGFAPAPAPASSAAPFGAASNHHGANPHPPVGLGPLLAPGGAPLSSPGHAPLSSPGHAPSALTAPAAAPRRTALWIIVAMILLAAVALAVVVGGSLLNV